MSLNTHLPSSIAHCLIGATALALSISAAVAQEGARSAPAAKEVRPVTSAIAPPVVSTILARGPSGAVITVADVLSELQRAPEKTREAVLSRSDSLQQLTSNLLTRRVLAGEARRDGLTSDPLVAAGLAVAGDRVLSDVRLAKLDAQNMPSEAALDGYARNLYLADAGKFEKPAQTRVRHILLPNTGPESLQKAQSLLAELRAGASFEEMAKSHSTDQGSAARGGDLGFFGAGQMVRPFEDAVSALKKSGDLSEPVETQFGYHLIRLEERREKSRQSYEEVRAQLQTEARIAILNEARVQKAQNLNREFVFERANIDALSKQAKP